MLLVFFTHVSSVKEFEGDPTPPLQGVLQLIGMHFGRFLYWINNKKLFCFL